MQQFNAEAICPKCGHKDISARFCERARAWDSCWSAVKGEHIHRCCRRCLYEWFEAPLNGSRNRHEEALEGLEADKASPTKRLRYARTVACENVMAGEEEGWPTCGAPAKYISGAGFLCEHCARLALSKGWKLTKLPDLDEGMGAMMEAASEEEGKKSHAN